MANTLTFFILFIGLLGSYAQTTKKTTDKLNLVGTWVLDYEESSFGMRDESHFRNYVMDISILGDEITITKKYVQKGQGVERKYLFFSDGRGEKNLDQKSKTKWTGHKLERKFDYKTNFGWMDVSEEYRLSNDFKKLIFESKSEVKTTSFQDNYRLVFLRKE